MKNSNKKNVLIVNNHALTRFGLMTALKTRKNVYDVIEAETGETGIELSKKIIPDILIIDLCLSGINGIETIKQIKNINEKIKIIILTAQNNDEQVLDSLCAGAQAYCLNDIKPEKMIHVIESIYEGAVWFDPAISKNILNILINKREKTKKEKTEPNQNKEKIQLTERELDVLKLIVKGFSNAEISENLCVSIHTAKAHVCNILHKLSVDDRTQAAIKTLKDKII